MSKKKKIRNVILTVSLWMMIWQVVAVRIDNQIFLPSPVETMESFLQLLQSEEFFYSIFHSLGSIAKGFLLGVWIGTFLAMVASISEFLETFISLPIRMIKATPVASFTILALFWMDSSKLSILVSFFMVFPVIYTNVFTGIQKTEVKLLEMANVFQIRWYYRVCFLYVPAVLPYLFSACSVAIGLAWKSGIAAEVIGLTKNSIGNHLYQAKIYLEMPELFAWSFVIISISILSEFLVLWLLRLLEQKLYETSEREVKELEDTIEVQMQEEVINNLQTTKAYVTKNQIEKEKQYESSIKLKDITKAYRKHLVLNQVSLELTSKQPIAIMGTSGVGKTTLLRIVLGVEKPDVGSIQKENVIEKYSVVFQENRLCEQLTVEKNLRMICRTKKQREEIPELLNKLGLSGCAKQKVYSLSGGMKRRVAIGRAILFDGAIVLMDEPFQGLDVKTKEIVLCLIKEKLKGKIVLLITHEEKEAIDLGCTIIKF